MDKKNLKTPVNSDKENFVSNNVEFPVQQTEGNEEVSDKTVKEAVKELNPDKNSMDSRG